jgi:hypothetical protein
MTPFLGLILQGYKFHSLISLLIGCRSNSLTIQKVFLMHLLYFIKPNKFGIGIVLKEFADFLFVCFFLCFLRVSI